MAVIESRYGLKTPSGPPGPALYGSSSQSAAAGPVDLSLTHLEAASGPKGEGVCARVRQIQICAGTRASLSAKNGRRSLWNGRMKNRQEAAFTDSLLG